MNPSTWSPRHKLVAAALLALLAPLAAALNGASAATAARVILGVAAAGGLAFWFIRARGGLGTKFKDAPRLNVVQRAGLSQRTGVALIEVDGKPYLIVHGDGFAKITPTRRPTRVALRAVPELSKEAAS